MRTGSDAQVSPFLNERLHSDKRDDDACPHTKVKSKQQVATESLSSLSGQSRVRVAAANRGKALALILTAEFGVECLRAKSH